LASVTQARRFAARSPGADQRPGSACALAFIQNLLPISEKENFHAGKETLFGNFVGQVMKATQGKANPAQVNELLKKKLAP
jgi:aspartyl-tRNA(Asn)/glutamyl-tRNA(Gln) amidotransferase subunit B